MKKRIYIWSGVLIAVLAIWGTTRAIQASRNLVTLNVRDADVRDVVRKCQWQTWETIVVHKDVKGTVTMNVRNMPLEEALGIIGEQTSARSLAIYPIFSKNKSIVNLRKLVRGDIERESAGWTNFNTRGFGGRGPGGPGGFGDTVRGQNSLVTLNVSGKDLQFAALALSRFSRAQVVPEDGANATVTLSLRDTPFRDAVEEVAGRAKMKSEVFYALQAQPDFFARGDDDGERRRGRDGDGDRRGRFEGGDTNRAEMWAAMRQREMEATLATMTPEEQAKAKEEQQRFEELRNLPPEQRAERFQQLANDPQFRQRMESRGNSAFKYSKPEQRVERTRRIAEMRQRREQGRDRR